MKRVIWIWLEEGASKPEYLAWKRFIKVNMRVSDSVRFLVARSQEDLDFKMETLQKAGWTFGRWGYGWSVSFT
jgi:hypothetical protein